jgi:isopentenyl diphosphate isomerase/L-lactate dehydrogenase-like FMN-dependent dehydrogenase
MPRFSLSQAVAEPAFAETPVTADQVLNIADFEALAQAKLPPAHFGYLATGADDDRTVFLNHEAYSHIEIRSRRFADISKLDTQCKVLGSVWKQPLYFSAVSSMRAFHPEAEVAVARAAASREIQMMLSTGASCSPEEVVAARGAPLWQQLYATDDWHVTEAIVRRSERAGCTAIFLTVDSPPGRNSETLLRAMRRDGRDCTQCHVGGSHDMVRRAPMFAGIDVSRVTALSPNLSGNYLERLRKLVTVKFLVKGIVTAEDATQAVHAGVDGVVVSNHGGRQEETLRSTIECLPEIVAAVGGRVPVFIDGGIRRGTDIFKALALGATAVGIGRPQAWGLAAFGQSGVEAVSNILNRELRTIMRQAGTPDLAAIDKSHLAWAKS